MPMALLTWAMLVKNLYSVWCIPGLEIRLFDVLRNNSKNGSLTVRDSGHMESCDNISPVDDE